MSNNAHPSVANTSLRSANSTASSSNHHASDRAEFRTHELQLIGSMLPGIIHNMATPLSGVIGATQLLESKVEAQDQLLSQLDQANAEIAEQLHRQFEKHKFNLDLLSRNAKQLTDLLQVLVTRIQLSAADHAQPMSLCDLVRNEIKFLEANMAFKHKVKKEISLSDRPPAVSLVYADVVSIMDEFILQLVGAHNFKESLMEMKIGTDYSAFCAELKMHAKFIQNSETPFTFDRLNGCIARAAERNCSTKIENSRGTFSLILTIPR